MRLTICHETEYQYDGPISYALQQLRLTPKSRDGQTVVFWKCEVEGGKTEVEFEDEHANLVTLVRLGGDLNRFMVRCSGVVETSDMGGVVGAHGGFMPLWCFSRTTRLTRPGAGLRELLRDFDAPEGDIPQLHALSNHILTAVPYTPGKTNADTTSEEAIQAGHGVCQDHAHIFIAAARKLGFPARYVSGYLMMSDREQADAGHAWAEAHVPGVGWIGFDVSNGICPDDRHVRVATGMDSMEAAPISGAYFGSAHENMRVAVQVEQ